MKRHMPTLLVTLLCGVVGAFAQGNESISLRLSMLAVKTIRVDGKSTEQLVPSSGSVDPGDVISQVVSVKNATARTVRDLPVQLPVPGTPCIWPPRRVWTAQRPCIPSTVARPLPPRP